MSLRMLSLVLVASVACGGDMTVTKGEPTTAREKMLAEQKAHPEEADSTDGKNWGAWRFQGDRSSCFFLVGRKCFKTEKAACAAARCSAKEACKSEGGGPATLKCVAKT